MQKHPLITLGITCYNAESTIARAIASAQTQDWSNYEIVIADDCSTDSSVAIIEKIAKRDKRIKLYRHKKNKGVAATRNTIIANAKGEYLAFLDDDDEFYPARLTKLYHRLTEFESAHPGKPVLCSGGCEVFTEGSDKPIQTGCGAGFKPPEPHGIMVADDILFGRQIRGYCWGWGTGGGPGMARTEVWREFGFDESFRRGEDSDFNIRIALAGGYFISVDEILYKLHRIYTPDRNFEQQNIARLQLCEKHKDYLKSRGAYRAAMLRARLAYMLRKNPVLFWPLLAYACLTSSTVLMGIAQRVAKAVRNRQPIVVDKQK